MPSSIGFKLACTSAMSSRWTRKTIQSVRPPDKKKETCRPWYLKCQWVLFPTSALQLRPTRMTSCSHAFRSTKSSTAKNNDSRSNTKLSRQFIIWMTTMMKWTRLRASSRTRTNFWRRICSPLIKIFLSCTVWSWISMSTASNLPRPRKGYPKKQIRQVQMICSRIR